MAARALFLGGGKRATFELLKTPRFRNTCHYGAIHFTSASSCMRTVRRLCARYGKTSFLNCATACSAQGLAELANFPHVEMLCGITRCVPSTKPPSGGEPWRPSQISRTPVAMDGHQTPQVCCPFTGWTSCLHLKRCWSWFHVAGTGCATRRYTCKIKACLALMCASAPGMKCSQ